MSDHEFKVGDKVRRRPDCGGLLGVKAGGTYTVSAVDNAGYWIGIEGHQHRTVPYPFIAEAFDLVETTSPIDEEIEKVQADKAAAKNRLFDLRLLRSLANDNGYTLTKEA